MHRLFSYPMLDFLEHLLNSLPLEVFVFVGTVIDEIISPIPAFLVLLPAGIAAHTQDYGPVYLLLLAVISAVARTGAGFILYLFADKLEDILFAHNRKFFGTSHTEVEALGKRLGKYKPTRSWLALFFMHALPVFPGTLLSLGSGFIRLKMPIFLTATLAGSFISALFFLYLGYAGVQTAELLRHLDVASQITTILILLGVGVWLFARYQKRKVK